jgi:aryl-alcohol dehydrogenase-like predicted oxidoreductase
LTIDEELRNQPHADKFDDDAKYVNARGLSRKHIFDAVDASLKRLELDYIDLYQIHRFDQVSFSHLHRI